MAKAYADARVPVTSAGRASLCMIMVDAEELRRAIGNLVDNAVRHAHTRVEIASLR